MSYSTIVESRSLLDLVFSLVNLPSEIADRKDLVIFKGTSDQPYYPIPFKETELTAALKAVEGCVVSALAESHNPIHVDLEKTTAFLCQTYLSSINGHGKLDPEAKKLIKGVRHPA